MADEQKDWTQNSGVDQEKASALQRRLQKQTLAGNVQESWDNLKKAFSSDQPKDPPQGR